MRTFLSTFHPRLFQLRKKLFSAAYEARHTNSVGVILYPNNSDSRRKISALFPIEVPVAMCCLMMFMWSAAHLQQFEQVPGNQVSWWTGNSTTGYPRHAAHEKWSWQMHTLNTSNLGTWNTPIISIVLRLFISCPTWLAKCLLRC